MSSKLQLDVCYLG